MKSFHLAGGMNTNVASFFMLFICLLNSIPPAHATQNISTAFADNLGNIYTLAHDNKLHWYQHHGRLTGTAPLTQSGESKVLTSSYSATASKVFSGGAGIIYTINTAGQLVWSHYNDKLTANQTWAQDSKSSIIGTGWGKYTHVFSGGDGIIYAITSNGKMLWFRHIGWQDGTNTWVKDSGKQIGKGWQGTLKVFSGGNGVIYSTIQSGRLRWHLHKGRLTGTNEWLNNGIHRVVGFNWQNFDNVFSGGDGIIYSTTTNGDILWHRHNGWLTGKNEWAAASNKIIAHPFFNHTP